MKMVLRKKKLVCESGCMKLLKHVLMECKAYASIRKAWWEKILQVSGKSGVAWVSEEGVGSSVGCDAVPLTLMLGGNIPGVDESGRLRIIHISARFLESLWDERVIKLYGPHTKMRGVHDGKRYDTN